MMLNHNMEQSIYALEQQVGQDGQAQGLEQGIEVIVVDSDDMSVCSNQAGADECSLSSTDHHPRDCHDAACPVGVFGLKKIGLLSHNHRQKKLNFPFY